MSKKNQTPCSTERREFLKMSGIGIMGAIVASKLLTSADIARADELPMVKEDDPQAKALGYHVDAKKVDTKKWAKRAGPEGGKQFCYNCQFYQAKGDAKASKSAPCMLFPQKQVAGQGWCNSWTQNPNVKG